VILDPEQNEDSGMAKRLIFRSKRYEVLYPLVGREKLQSLVAEAKTKGTYQKSVQTKIHFSYTYHYRQMLPPLLEVLTFRSKKAVLIIMRKAFNEGHKPLIFALAECLYTDGQPTPANP